MTVEPPDDGWKVVLRPTAMHYWCVCGTAWSTPWESIRGDMTCPACLREPVRSRVEQEVDPSGSVLPEGTRLPAPALRLVED